MLVNSYWKTPSFHFICVCPCSVNGMAITAITFIHRCIDTNILSKIGNTYKIKGEFVR